MTRPLGVILIEVFISNYKSQVAASMTTRHLGATYMEYSVYMIEMNKPDFFKVAIFIGTSLKPSLCSAQDLGATCNMDMRERTLQNSQF